MDVLGIRRFYLFEHMSRIPSINAWLPLMHEGIVVYNYFMKTHPPDLPFRHATLSCLKSFGTLHKWMAFLDIDEFIVLKVTPPPSPEGPLSSFLKDYDAFGGLGINWLQFGSDGHKERPEGGVIGNYRSCWSNEHVKTIVRLDRVVITASATPHNRDYLPGYYSVDSDKKMITPPGWTNVPPKTDKIVIHHYTLKSRDDFDSKKKKGTNDGTTKDEGYWSAVEGETSQPKSEELNRTCHLLLQYKGRFIYKWSPKKQERSIPRLTDVWQRVRKTVGG